MATTDARTSSNTDREKIAAIRAELPATTAHSYLNAGTNGPLSRRAYAALVEQAQLELAEGRVGAQAFQRLTRTSTEARTAMATVLRCDPGEIALTHNTTEGMNIALMGLDWRPGDEVVTATTEHPGGLYPVYLLRERYGVRIRMTPIGLAGYDPRAELRAALSPRTRAVVLSHVSWATGMVLPMRELAELTHRAGAVLICDAAQACGMVPSPVRDLAVDAYACSGQKWLCGPDGTGALYVRAERLGEIHQTYIGYHGVRTGMSDHEGHFVPPASAERYEAATLSPGGLRALTASLRWMTEEIRLDWIYARIASLGRYCYDALAGLAGVAMHIPADNVAGLIHFTLEDVAPADLTARLAEHHILIRNTPYPLANRVSTGFYNTEEEIDQLIAAIAAVRATAA